MKEFHAMICRKTAAVGGAVTLLAAATLTTTPAHADYEVSGNIGVVSDYVFRGITSATESDGAAVQGGFDLEADNGFYAGYWGSNLGYGSDNLTTTVENDLYVGYAGDAFDVGLLYYWYMDDSDASGAEPYVSVDVGPVTLGAAYMAQDISWSNQGDIFWSAGTGFDLGNDFALDATLGFYTYEDSGKYIPSSGESSGFRSLDITLSKTLTDTPASMFATYVLGGEDRDGMDQEDKIVIGFSYGF
ncbi:MAG: TorF family putative porin [Pseudohongiellaceae bacterium]